MGWSISPPLALAIWGAREVIISPTRRGWVYPFGTVQHSSLTGKFSICSLYALTELGFGGNTCGNIWHHSLNVISKKHLKLTIMLYHMYGGP